MNDSNGMRHFGRLARQRGMSGPTIFLVIVLLFGAASIGLRLLPHYLDHNTIHGQILQLLENPELARFTANQIHRELAQNLKMNNIREFETKDKLEIQKGSGTLQMDFRYEVREHMFWNVDVVLTFEEQYEKVL